MGDPAAQLAWRLLCCPALCNADLAGQWAGDKSVTSSLQGWLSSGLSEENINRGTDCVHSITQAKEEEEGRMRRGRKRRRRKKERG